MKKLTIDVTEQLFLWFREHSERTVRPLDDLIREAMAKYLTSHIQGKNSLLDSPPLSLGKVLEPVTANELFGETLDDCPDW